MIDEDNYFGKVGINDLIVESWLVDEIYGNLFFKLKSVVGLVGVWVKENIREVIYEVLECKEIFVILGLRIKFCFFVVWDVDIDFFVGNEWVVKVYKNGVFMGSDLRS